VNAVDERNAVDWHYWGNVVSELELLALELRAKSMDEVLGPNRELRVSRVRHAVWAKLREIDPEVWTFPRIGRIFGRHHTTVMFGVDRHLNGRPPCKALRRPWLARSA